MSCCTDLQTATIHFQLSPEICLLLRGPVCNHCSCNLVETLVWIVQHCVQFSEGEENIPRDGYTFMYILCSPRSKGLHTHEVEVVIQHLWGRLLLFRQSVCMSVHCLNRHFRPGSWQSQCKPLYHPYPPKMVVMMTHSHYSWIVLCMNNQQTTSPL